jgi:ketosteroid isomerase-like protein
MNPPESVSTIADAARALYEAMAARDPQAILDAMTDDFVGDASEGMPLDVGGVHRGPEAMMSKVWGPVFAAYDVRVLAERFLICAPDAVVVLGHYRGTARDSGRPLDARFAHVLRIRGQRVAGLEQFTDTRRWPVGAVAAT